MRPPLAIVLLCAAAAAAAAGCAGNPARDRALRTAKDARARGDLVGETVAMRQACAADRTNRKLCDRTFATDQHALALFRAGAAGACQRVDAGAPHTIGACLGAVAPLRQLFPGDPDVARFADVAGNAMVSRCGVEPPVGFAEALRRIRCIEAGAAQVDTVGYADQITAARRGGAAIVTRLAATRPVVDRPGALAALVGAAACLTGDAELAARATAALRGFAASTAPTLHVRATGLDPVELCAETAAKLGGMTCAAKPTSRAIVIEASVQVAAIKHDVRERPRTEKYLASVDRVENPAYRTRARDELYSREAARDAEAAYRGDQQGCDAATDAQARAGSCYDCPEQTDQEVACRRAEDGKQLWDQREADWRRAKADLDDTPAILEHENWRQTSFIVRDHTWSAPWQAELRALPGQAVRTDGTARATDAEHTGSDLAEIGADPLTPPGAGWYRPSVRGEVAAELSRLVKTELLARVEALRSKCPGAEPRWDDPVWLDCWAATAVVAGVTTLGQTLVEWESQVDGRRTGTELPAPRCR